MKSGASGELLVSFKLLRAGMPVWRALAPNCEYDLVTMRSDKTLLKVEAKVTYRRKNGEIYFGSYWNLDDIDVLAVVLSGSTEVIWFMKKDDSRWCAVSIEEVCCTAIMPRRGDENAGGEVQDG